MRICFIGADLEENLGLGILSAIAERHGHRVQILPFNDARETDRLVARVRKARPDLVGMSIQFQHRAPEFVALARKLRADGYAGHLTCGAQFPTLAWRETLVPQNGFDTVVLHDGEETLVDLLAALETGGDLMQVAGLALRGPDGEPVRTAPRRLVDDLDVFPYAKRYRAHNRHMGVPFIPIIGGRGCWGKCNYCSIIAFYDDAIEYGGGREVRLRSPDNIAAEMALLLEAAGGQGIFCFHDDNFVFPGEKFSLKRIRRIREALDSYGVGKVGLVGKARPDCITPDLARELAALGVIRLYVGVENGSQTGGDHLRRGTQQDHVRGALKACREAGIFVCYNLLVFEPEGTIEDVRENVRFIRDHAEHPVNFCRAEPYYGTALHLELGKQQDLDGSYLGFNYRIVNDRLELLFRICSAAFRERNFSPAGVANRYMGLGYAANVLRRFYDVNGSSEPIRRRALDLTAAISRDTASYLEKAIAIAENVALDDWDTIERKTALLGLEIAAADAHWHDELDALYADMRALNEAPEVEPVVPKPTARFQQLKGSMALGLGMSIVFAGHAAGCESDVVVVDPVPSDTASSSSGKSSSSSGMGEGGFVVDPVPADGGGGMGGLGGEGGMVVDPPPPDGGGGMGGMGGDGGSGGTAALDGAEIPSAKRLAILGQQAPAPVRTRLRLIDQWFDTSPKRTARTADLPLFDPPAPRLTAARDGDALLVRIEGLSVPASTRWEADGELAGAGTEIRWKPRDPSDRVRVAIRSRGGIAVLSLRAEAAKPLA